MALLRFSTPWPLRVLLGALGLCAAASLNLGLARGLTAAPKFAPLAVGLAVLPGLAIAFGALVERHRALLAWGAFALPLSSLAVFYERVPLPGGTAIFWSDVLVVLAIGAWLAARLTRRGASTAPSSNPLFGFLLAAFAVAIALGVFRGSERYGASLVGQPFRIVLYAAIALALVDVTAERAWRAITLVFYGGAVLHSAWGTYLLATGGSQTDQIALSTGGSRVLANSTAIYLTGSLVCALLNLERRRGGGRQILDGAIAGLALYGVILTFNRSTWAAVALILPLLLLTRRRLLTSTFAYLPLAAVAVAGVALIVHLAAPELLTTMTARVSGTSGDDENVRWRQLANEVALEGVSEDPWRGVGFGRTGSFVINGQVVEIHGDPHNSYVYLLAGGGILALGSFLLVFTAYAVGALRRAFASRGESQALVLWCLAMWLVFAMNALAGPVFSDPRMMLALWVVIALPGVVVTQTRKVPAHGLRPSPVRASTP